MEEQKPNLYSPNEKEKSALKYVYDNFQIMWENNQKSYEQFGGKTLQTYLDNGRKAINILNKPRPDGRSNIKSVTPLNKLKAILARIALKRPDIAVEAVNTYDQIDVKRGQIAKDLYNWSYENLEEENTADIEYFFKAFDCNIDGSIITYEGVDSQTHTNKEITKFDPNTGEVEWEEKEFKTDKCFSQVIKPEDFFIWNPYMRSLQMQPRVAWRTVYSKAKFDSEFGKYKNAKFVMTTATAKEFYPDQEAYYQQQLNTRVTEDQIEVLRMFDKYDDRMTVIANGVVLQDTPMVWNNGKPKRYPFAKTIASPFAGGEFFWGMHLWQVLEGDVSALETLYNLGIEQMKISVNPPIFVPSGNDIEDNMLLAGRTIEVDNPDSIKQFEFSRPDGSYFNFIQEIAKNIDFASTDPVSSGQNVKDTTARGQVIAEENARKLLSLFNIMMENLVLQEAKLRIPNIIQFQIIAGKTYRVNNTTVGNEQGVREIKVVNDQQEMESKDLLDMIEKKAELEGVNLERLNITVNYLQNIIFNIKVVTDSSYQQGKSIAIALEVEFQSTMAKLYPNIFQASSEIFFKDLAKAYDKDPQKYLEAAQQSVNNTGIQQMQQLLGKEQGNSKLTGELTGNQMSLPKLSGVES